MKEALISITSEKNPNRDRYATHSVECPHDASFDEILERFRDTPNPIDYDVVLEPNHLFRDGAWHRGKDSQVVRVERDGSFQPIAVTGDEYGLIPNKHFFSQVHKAAQEMGFFPVSYADMGHSSMMCYESLKRINIPNKKMGRPDPIKAQFVAIGRHGVGSSRFHLQNFRVICLNMMTSILNQTGNRYSFRHTKNADRLFSECLGKFKNSFDASESFAKIYQKMVETSLKKSEFHRLLIDCYGHDSKPLHEVPTRTANKIERLAHLFENGMGNHGATCADGLNAITEFMTHERPVSLKRNGEKVHEEYSSRLWANLTRVPSEYPKIYNGLSTRSGLKPVKVEEEAGEHLAISG